MKDMMFLKNFSAIPKNVDQPMATDSGLLNANGKFYGAALNIKKKKKGAELIKVYEKIKDGIWVYIGVFELKILDREIRQKKCI